MVIITIKVGKNVVKSAKNLNIMMSKMRLKKRDPQENRYPSF